MIYICIPTHNEQQTVGVVLWKLRQVLTEFPRDYQLLVADDASTDKTPEVLEPYTRVLPLTVVRCDRRVGQAASLELLLREAVRRSEYPKRDVIITLQADFSEEPDDVVPMIKKIEAGADVVVGNKVSMTRPTRLRRMARALGSFFVRGLKWPEGVATPFEGYRAYRLYSVKRAVEDRAGRRLVRYDSWAGHAELLRAVLPHARRVEALDVEDRPDRLQRPRRERPFAAAMQVRGMIRDIDPLGLVGVEELDRMAASASRSRDRASVLSQRVEVARAAGPDRGNGRGRPRDARNGRERTAPKDDRPRREPAAKGDGRGSARSTSPRSASAQPPAGERATQPERPERERTPRPRSDRPRPPKKTTDKPARAETAAAALPADPANRPGNPSTVAGDLPTTALAPAAGLATPGGEGAPPSEARQPAPDARPKRKRRRKRRASGGTAPAPATESSGSSADDVGESTEGAADNGDGNERSEGAQGSTRTGEAKRRRRRGGRGRRRGPRPAAAGGEGGEGGEMASGDTAPAEPPLRSSAPGEG